MKTPFLKTFVIGTTILFFTLGGVFSFDSHQGTMTQILGIENAYASGGGSSGGGHSSGGSHSYSQPSNSVPSSQSTYVAPVTPQDTQAPECTILYPQFENNRYEFESDTGDFELVASLTDNQDTNPQVRITYQNQVFTDFKSFTAPEGESLLVIDINDNYGNTTKKILTIVRKLPEPQIAPIVFSEVENIPLQIIDNTIEDKAIIEEIPGDQNIQDSDGDGLSDDLELHIGTHPNNADSDGDGVSDKDELEDFKNPLGAGELFRDLARGTKVFASKVATQSLVKLGAIRANSRALFYPNSAINRAEATKLLMLADGDVSSKTSFSLSFEDVDTNSWFAPYIAQAVEKGVVNGNKKTFEPLRKMNRAEALKMILESSGFSVPPIPPSDLGYDDVKVTQWYAPYVSFALVNNLQMPAWTPHFYPAREMSRGEFIEILYKAVELKKAGTFQVFESMPEAQWFSLLEEESAQQKAVIVYEAPKKAEVLKKIEPQKPIVTAPSRSQSDTIQQQKAAEAARQKAQEIAQQQALADQKAREDAAAKAKAAAQAEAQKVAAQKAATEAAARAQAEAAARAAAQQATHTTTRTS